MTSQSIEYLKVTIILYLLFLTFTENEHEVHGPAQFSSSDKRKAVLCESIAKGPPEAKPAFHYDYSPTSRLLQCTFYTTTKKPVSTT